MDDADPADEFPIIHGFVLANTNAAVLNLDELECYVSIHRYVSDHSLFDPTR